MLIPWDTANPLNSFLNSGLILKLSDSFSLSGALYPPSPSACLLVKARPLRRDDDHRRARHRSRIQNSAFLAIQKGRILDREPC